MVLSLDINGQTLTELLYYFDHATSKLCRPTCDGGLGLNNDSIMKIRSILDEFSRSQGFVHYSAISPGSRQRLAHHTIKLQIVTRQDVGSSGILGQGALKTLYQHIVPDAPTLSLRELLGARPDLSPSAKDGLLMYRNPETDETITLQQDTPLQAYGIGEGSEILLQHNDNVTDGSIPPTQEGLDEGKRQKPGTSIATLSALFHQERHPSQVDGFSRTLFRFLPVETTYVKNEFVSFLTP